MTPEESAAILFFLYAHCERPELGTRFHWGPNSIAFWDNLCTQHLAIWDYYPNKRSRFRVQIAADVCLSSGRRWFALQSKLLIHESIDHEQRVG